MNPARNARLVLRLLTRRMAKFDRRLTVMLTAAVESALNKASRSLPANVRSAGAAPPARLLPRAGVFPRPSPNVESELAFTALVFGRQFARALGRVMIRLRRVNPR